MRETIAVLCAIVKNLARSLWFIVIAIFAAAFLAILLGGPWLRWGSIAILTLAAVYVLLIILWLWALMGKDGQP